MEVAEHQLATGELSHYAYRYLACLLLAQHDLPAVAERLRLTMQQLRTLVYEATETAAKPEPPRPRLKRGKPPPVPGPDLAMLDRVRILWQRGWHLNEIADELNISRQAIRELVVPRWTIDGPCRTCVDYALKVYEPPKLVRCPHYEVAFELTERGVVLRDMTRKEFRAALADRQRTETPSIVLPGHDPGRTTKAARGLRVLAEAQARRRAKPPEKGSQRALVGFAK